jgi:hypothetical protein
MKGKTIPSLLFEGDFQVTMEAFSPRTALKISQLTDGGMPPTYDSMH